ncbi:GTP cyclohydrolase FolE2 [candidate division CSSED10-310 bacterium]|uniref:GTP cyclohydrolase FolE2 n=1 Tax=candidate division CSSED10-310 bacterium TaxID=2855610 RepID=A0ABV6Z3D2_UNCC1
MTPDIQNERPTQKIDIDKVGVKNIEYPISVMDKKKEMQPTIARISMYVNLPGMFRGTHMSRFINILNKHRGLITQQILKAILLDMKRELKAKSSHIEIHFPYFLEKQAPVSNNKGLMSYNCGFFATLNADDNFSQHFKVRVPVLNLCPCSKEISRWGAHNQRSIVTVTICSRKLIWMEDIIDLVESCASSPLYPLLKREDEKYITEHAYQKARFVEDVVREVAFHLDEIPRLTWYEVESENLESIHNHNVYAYISKKF